MGPSNHITALNCGECTNGVHFFIASLPISLPGFLLGFSGLFQNFSTITDITATPIPNAKTMNAVKILSKEISLKALSLHTTSEYLWENELKCTLVSQYKFKFGSKWRLTTVVIIIKRQKIYLYEQMFEQA